MLGSGSNWRTLSRQFGETRPTYAVDMRNHGESPHHPEMSLELMAEDVAHFAETVSGAPVDLIGHSLGGKVAMQLALTQPFLVAKIVIVDIAPRAYSPGHRVILDALLGLDVATLNSRGEAVERLREAIPSKATRSFLAKNLDRTDDGSYEWQIGLREISDNYDALLCETRGGVFHGPTLFIHGEKSEYVQESDQPLIDTRFPNNQTHTVKNAGHWVHADRPAEFFEVVSGFLS